MDTYVCPRCNRPDRRPPNSVQCWCDECHPRVVEEMTEHCDKPGLCVGPPHAAIYEYEPDPEVLAAVLAERANPKPKRRVRLVSKSVPDAPVIEYDL